MNKKNTSLKCKLSIVIPVYNNSLYLSECIDSIIKSSIKKQFYEVICIDDGSTDECPELLDQYSRCNTNITVIHQKNQYAGKARNVGLEFAKGDYIWFVDGDDYLVEGALEEIFDIISNLSFDISIFNYNKLDREIHPVKLFNFETTNSIVVNSKEIKYAQIKTHQNIHKIVHTSVVPWNKVYSREFIINNNLRFDEIKAANDRSFYFKAISISEEIFVFDKAIINYRCHSEGSLTNNVTRERLECAKKSFISTQAYINDPVMKMEIAKAMITDVIWMIHVVNPGERWQFFKDFVKLLNSDLNLSKMHIQLDNSRELSLYNLYKSRTNLLNKSETKSIPIVLASDINYIPYAAVTIQSIIDYTNPDYYYDIYILHLKPLGLNNIRRIEKMAKINVKITFFNVDPLVNCSDLYTRAHYSVEMFNRILIPEIFCFYSKVLYLDSDMILRSDVQELYATDLSKHLMAVVKSYSNENMHRYVRNVLKLNEEEYFNSGMLLINTGYFYKEKIKNKCLELIKTNRTYVCPDQDVLNLTCSGKVLLFPDDTWNFQWHVDMENGYNLRYKNQKLIHYTSGEKAWNCPTYELSQYFWECARRTVFYEEILFKNVFSMQNVLKNGLTVDKLVNKQIGKHSINSANSKINNTTVSKDIIIYTKQLCESGSKKDFAECLEVCRSHMSDYNAVFRLAQLYRNGLGVPQDLFRACLYMQMAIDMGHKGAVKEYIKIAPKQKGTLFQNKELLEVLSDIEDKDALSEMISIYISVLPDDGLQSYYNLGKIYCGGTNIDLILSEWLFRKATELGTPGAKEALDKILKEKAESNGV